MTRIDDQEGKLLESARDDGHQERAIAEGATAIAAIASPLLAGWVTAALGTLSVVGSVIGNRKATDQLRAMLEILQQRLETLGGRIEDLRERLTGPEAAEAMNAACRAAALAASVAKAEAFGSILGTIGANADPNWNEAAELIRAVEQFTSDDVTALLILWRVQRTQFRAESRSGRTMSMKSSDYLTDWAHVMREVKAKGISDEDWTSRCWRLGGFGLAAQVQQGTVSGGTGAYAFRLTGKAVRLLGALGYNVDPTEYPRQVYAADGRTRRIEDELEYRELDRTEWFDGPPG